MKTEHIEVLEFRDELMKLCKKYKCNICGSYNDFNDDIVFEFNNRDYYVKADGYSVFTTDANEQREYIIDEYVRNMFPQEMRRMQGLNNVKIGCIVFSNDDFKANEKMNDILGELILNESDFTLIKTKEGIKEIRLKDGTRYMWVKPNDNSRGYRCNHAFIDRNLSLETIEHHIIPIAYYCGKDTVGMF